MQTLRSPLRPPSAAQRAARWASAGMLAVALLSAAPALAGCTDPAAAEVNWRRCYLDGRDLPRADLRGAMLRDATFQRAMLEGANLANADAYRAKFVSADMKGAILDGARLIEADLTRAVLDGGTAKGADLRNAKLVGVSLVEVDLTGAQLGGADLRNADLSRAIWVDGKRVCAPNSIGQCN